MSFGFSESGFQNYGNLQLLSVVFKKNVATFHKLKIHPLNIPKTLFVSRLNVSFFKTLIYLILLFQRTIVKIAPIRRASAPCAAAK